MISLLTWIERHPAKFWSATLGASVLLVVAQFVDIALRFDGPFFVLFPLLTRNPLTWLTTLGMVGSAYPWFAAAVLLVPTSAVVLRVAALRQRALRR